MYIDVNSFKINNINMGQYLKSVKYGYYKTWGKDTGRNNLSGTFTGTLIGIFPKFELEFHKLTKADVEIIVPLLDASQQSVTYYDPNAKANKTILTYSGDYDITSKDTIANRNSIEISNVSLIARAKR